MASSLSWLQSCKVSQLKTIAYLTGLNSTGAKPLLTSRLLRQLPHSLISNTNSPSHQSQPTTIVSIDMGIRNLAYCRLTLPRASTQPTIPLLTEWTRVAISRPPVAEGSNSESEQFDPATYSQHAYDLVEKLVVHENPSHILIERQRFRSMGGSAVQEWTLRVNMFEAMLYAVLTTLAARGIWKGAVHAVSPAKVAGFWLQENGDNGPQELGEQARRRKSKNFTLDEHGESDLLQKGTKNSIQIQTRKPKIKTKTKIKTQKINLVSQWLNQTPQIFSIQPKSPAAQTVDAYLGKSRGAGRRKQKISKTASSSSCSTSASITNPVADEGQETETSRSPPLETETKRDDLADCLLQGMAWIQWERNRARILERGAAWADGGSAKGWGGLE